MSDDELFLTGGATAQKLINKPKKVDAKSSKGELLFYLELFYF